ncbi:MAG: alpha/beta hydrolase [Clostridia bacterium]|nr:alpha/beta hydrolase [Clostridia bacterium]
MNKLRYCYAMLVQKGSNLLETLAYPLLYQKKGDLVTELNVAYGESKNTKCDYYYAPSQEKKPVLIYIHGGGWISGIKLLRKPYCFSYAKEGFFVMNTGYDYAPQKKFPQPLQQIFTAIESLLDNAEKYNLDTSRIVVGGESAGAYYSAFVAAVTKNRDLYDKLGISFKYRDSFDINACILLNGALDHSSMASSRFPNMTTFLNSFFDMTKKELLDPANGEKTLLFSPVNFIDSSFPPTVVGEGRYDGLKRESKAALKKLNELGIKHTSFMAEGIVGIHGFCLASNTKEGKRCFKISLDFVNEVLER